ncbi:S-adenosylmethionine-dependent methyltransferase Rv2258c-like [Diadema antillarum]|uniref:S-adenosylmethionine-dependent methyltransferase Rv2258c-like n=1 Tax=Diadema antillarum TaxID=105358 RepID=UPI003A854B90
MQGHYSFVRRIGRAEKRKCKSSLVISIMAESGAKEETSEAFANRFSTILTHGFVALAVSLGVDTGIFDALVHLKDRESTSQEIADAAGLKERYVKEWLGCMSVARLVDINPETEKYRLPEHRAPFFTRGTDAHSLAVFSTELPMLSEVYSKLADCLKKDGPSGLPYSDYSLFHSFMASLSGRWVRNHLVQDFIPSMPKIEEKLKSGVKVLDLGCGRGVATLLFAENYPNSSVIGLEISEECVSFAREQAEKKKLTNVEFVQCDAAELPSDWSNSVDYVYVYDVIHDLAQADKVLKEIHRILKPGGVFSMIEPDCETKQSRNVGLDRLSLLYTVSLFHCLPISLYFDGSVGLGTAWGRDKAKEYISNAGLSTDAVVKLPASIHAHFICSKPN